MPSGEGELPKETRFWKVVPTFAMEKSRVMLVGCGAVGSWAALMLAKCGLGEIELWDHDRVENVNIGVQLYDERDVDEWKVDALAKRLRKTEPRIRVIKHREKFVKGSRVSPLNNVVVTAVDNLRAREVVYRKLSFRGKWHRFYIDSRMGATTWEMHATGFGGDPRVFDRPRYEAGLKGLRGLPPAPCGAQSTPFNGPVLAGMITSQVTRWFKGDSFSYWLAMDVANHNIISGKESLNASELRGGHDGIGSDGGDRPAAPAP